MDGAPTRCDVAVVGGGIVGLALALELARGEQRAHVCVLEREDRLAAHQTGHNSGVIHAGVYYRPGSLKAELCVRGAALMYAFCEKHSIPHARCGKLIVATRESELDALEELERRGHANGVRLRRLSAAEIPEHEPHATGVAALHSPDTGIVDYGVVAAALATELQAAGGAVALGCAVSELRPIAGGVRVLHAQGALEARQAVVCAGAWADRLARAGGAPADPRIVPFRGSYLRLRPGRTELVRGLIYPVPDPRLPFLGVHLTRTIAGEVLIGPTARLAAGRSTGQGLRTGARDLAQTIAWPGTWRLLARHHDAALAELHHWASNRALLREAARFVPALAPGDALPAFAGTRAQALGRDGALLDDFAFSTSEHVLHVRNAPSPAATSALAIAGHLATRLTGR